MMGNSTLASQAPTIHDRQESQDRIQPREARMGSSAVANVKGSKRAAAFIGVIAMSAAAVAFGLSAMTSKSFVSTCNTDAQTVETAVAAFQTENPNVAVTSKLLTGHTDGGPYLASWPKSGGTHYAIAITPSGAVMVSAPSTARPVSYDAAKICDGAS
jgi:hypothetical protein